MRALADAQRIRRFMRELGGEADVETAGYLTGGTTAVLVGWRATTVDIDLKLVPKSDRLLRVLPRLKQALHVNVELIAPSDFIPVPAGWEERSPFVAREGLVTFRHFDPYAQALAKLERAHAQDLVDVTAMVAARLVDPARALEQFAEIESELFRFPAVDPPAFRRRVEQAFSP